MTDAWLWIELTFNFRSMSSPAIHFVLFLCTLTVNDPSPPPSFWFEPEMPLHTDWLKDKSTCKEGLTTLIGKTRFVRSNKRQECKQVKTWWPLSPDPHTPTEGTFTSKLSLDNKPTRQDQQTQQTSYQISNILPSHAHAHVYPSRLATSWRRPRSKTNQLSPIPVPIPISRLDARSWLEIRTQKIKRLHSSCTSHQPRRT